MRLVGRSEQLGHWPAERAMQDCCRRPELSASALLDSGGRLEKAGSRAATCLSERHNESQLAASSINRSKNRAGFHSQASSSDNFCQDTLAAAAAAAAPTEAHEEEAPRAGSSSQLVPPAATDSSSGAWRLARRLSRALSAHGQNQQPAPASTMSDAQQVRATGAEKRLSGEAAPTGGQPVCAEQIGDLNVDAGYAWIVLVVIFLISASTFGTARAYGLIFERLARDQQAQGARGRTMAALPFTLMGACENMAGPLSGYLLTRSQNSWRLMVFAGSSLIALGHLLAALAVDTLFVQLVSLGLMCGLGLSFVTISFFQINNAYFVRYRSTAFGIGLTGAAFGTLYISPICQLCLDRAGLSACYLTLAAVLAPNVLLSLLLKPKKRLEPMDNLPSLLIEHDEQKLDPIESVSLQLSAKLKQSQRQDSSGFKIRKSIKSVIANPMFHLIWPTQLLFCWFNFVFGMIILDLGRDKGLGEADLAYLLPVWVAGQLVGRLALGPIIDMNYLSYRTWTVICFALKSLVMFAVTQLAQGEQVALLGAPSATSAEQLASEAGQKEALASKLFLALIFALSTFIALLYILLNGQIVIYVEKKLQPLCIGISSFVGSFLLLPRANVIGYYRDTVGSYDSMISLFACVSLAAAAAWLLGPFIGQQIKWPLNLKPASMVNKRQTAPELRRNSSQKCCQKLLELSVKSLGTSLLANLIIIEPTESKAINQEKHFVGYSSTNISITNK